MGSEKACVLLTPRPASCIFQTADEKDDLPGEESVLEMLSYSKFSDLETWLCMPSSLRLPRSLDSSSSSSSSQSSVRSSSSVHGSNLLSLNTSRGLNVSQCSLCSRSGDGERSEKVHTFLSPTLVRDPQFLSTPVLTSTPLTPLTPAVTPAETTDPGARSDSSPSSVTVRKRRRLAANPGGLHWTSAGSVQRGYLCPASPDPSPVATVGAQVGEANRCSSTTDGVTLTKTVSAGEQFLYNSNKLKLLSRLERGTRRLRCHQVPTGGAAARYDCRKKPEGGSIGRLAQRWKRWSLGDGLNSDVTSWFYSGLDQSSGSLDRREVGAMQQMQSLQLVHRGRCPGPTSPNAAKRLYRNLSDKLRGSTSSIDDTYFFGKSDRLRKASTAQYSEVLFEAVEQQDLDTVQILLFQFSAEELDLNTPNCQGLTPLDISIMTNNAPIAKLLLRAGAKESPHFTSVESREAHLSSLVVEAERRAAELAAQAQREGLSLDACHNNKALRSWEWRTRLYTRMRTGFQHARPPEIPTMVRLSVSSSSSLSVTFQEPQCLNSTVVTKYRVEWSCLKDFSLLVGDAVLDNLQSLRFTITGLTTGRVYFVRVSAFNMKGWGPPACSLPPSAAPSNWRECDGREPKRRAQVEAMEKLLQQVRATHTLYCSGDPSKLQNPSRKQSVSRSLKHLFNSNKFVKTLKRGVYLATVLHHKDSLLVTTEEQIPIVEVDDSFGSSLMQDFLWFTKLSCLWEDVRWLRQSMSVSMSSSSTLQTRHKLLTAAAHMQNLLGTHNLGRVHYEPIKDRHGNVLLVTVRDLDSQTSSFNGKWTAVTKLQSLRKSLSTPEEPYALDILIITLQDLLSFQRRCSYRLSPGLYVGFLKLSSSVDQIRVLVSQRSPNMLCHTRIRENANVSREEWEWIQSLVVSSADSTLIGGEAFEEGLAAQSHTPLLFYELQTATKNLLKQINLPPHQARGFRLYPQEVVELGHGVSFLLLLPSADDVCSAPGQTNQLCPRTGFLHLPLQMFELVHLCSYKERCISLYCRISSVLDLDSLITQQALREAITDTEVNTAKERHQQVLDYIQQLEEMRRDLRWLTDALQFARYKQPSGGVPLSFLMPLMPSHTPPHPHKSDSTSSNMDYLPTPSPSPEPRRRTPGSDSQLCSDEDCSSEVFLPTDSDYDSSDALSPHQDTLSPPSSLHSHQTPQQDLFPHRTLGGSAPDVLRSSICPSDSDLSPSFIKDCKPDALTPTELSLPLSPCVPPLSPSVLPLSPSVPPLSPVSDALDSLSLSEPSSPPPPLRPPGPVKPVSAPAKRKLLSRSHRGQYFSGPQRWIRAQSGETPVGTLSEGVYTKQSDFTDNLTGMTYVSHASCVLEKRRSREPRPHVRKIFTQNITKTPPTSTSSPSICNSQRAGRGRGFTRGGVTNKVGEESGEPESESATSIVAQEVDSDDQTNAQVQEILSSAL